MPHTAQRSHAADTTFWGRSYGVWRFSAIPSESEISGDTKWKKKSWQNYHYGRKILEERGMDSSRQAVVDGQARLNHGV